MNAGDASDLLGYLRAQALPTFDPWERAAEMPGAGRVPDLPLARAIVAAPERRPSAAADLDGLRTRLADAVHRTGPFSTDALAVAESLARARRAGLPPDLLKVAERAGDTLPVGMPSLGVAAADLTTAVRRADREHPIATAVVAARASRRLDTAFAQTLPLGASNRAAGPRAAYEAVSQAVEDARTLGAVLRRSPAESTRPLDAFRPLIDEPAALAARLSTAPVIDTLDTPTLAGAYQAAIASAQAAREAITAYADRRPAELAVPAPARAMTLFEDVAPAIGRTSMLSVSPNLQVGDAVAAAVHAPDDIMAGEALNRGPRSASVTPERSPLPPRAVLPLPRSTDAAMRETFREVRVDLYRRPDRDLDGRPIAAFETPVAARQAAPAEPGARGQPGEAGYSVDLDAALDAARFARAEAGESGAERERTAFLARVTRNASDMVEAVLPRPEPWRAVTAGGEVRETPAGRVASVRIVRGGENRTVDVPVPRTVKFERDEILLRAGLHAARRAQVADRRSWAEKVRTHRPESVFVDRMSPGGAKVVVLADGKGGRVEAAVSALGHPLPGAGRRGAFALASSANADARTFRAGPSARAPVAEGSYAIERPSRAFVMPGVFAEARAMDRAQHPASAAPAGPILA